MVVVTTDECKYYFKNSKLQGKDFREDEESREKINWGCVPCIAIENPDGLACFELAKSCIAKYERVMKNSGNTFQYDDDGNIVWIPNEKRKKEDEVVLQAPVFYAGEGGKIEWVEKNINDGALENYKKTLIDLIFMVSCCPNVNDLGFTNADNSSALEKKFFPLEQSITYLDKSVKKELLAMWEAFTTRINLKKGTKYDFRNLQIKLQRNMPTDKQAETTRALSLRGLICDESVINLLPDELDAQSEIEKMKTQSEENLEENMKKIESFGKDGADAQGLENNKDEQDANDPKNASKEKQDASISDKK